MVFLAEWLIVTIVLRRFFIQRHWVHGDNKSLLEHKPKSRWLTTPRTRACLHDVPSPAWLRIPLVQGRDRCDRPACMKGRARRSMRRSAAAMIIVSQLLSTVQVGALLGQLPCVRPITRLATRSERLEAAGAPLGARPPSRPSRPLDRCGREIVIAHVSSMSELELLDCGKYDDDDDSARGARESSGREAEGAAHRRAAATAGADASFAPPSGAEAATGGAAWRRRSSCRRCRRFLEEVGGRRHRYRFLLARTPRRWPPFAAVVCAAVVVQSD